MSSQSSSSPKLFSDLEFKFGAMMWFSSTLDTNSPWGTSYPHSSLPAMTSSAVVPKKVEKVQDMSIKPPAKPIQQLFSSNEFVQVSSNQRWNTQNVRFEAIQPELIKKTSKISLPTPTAVLPAISEPILSSLPIESEIEEDSSAQNLYKTEYCRSFEETGSCRYGMKCQFAHGSNELRPVNRHPKYKTEVCKTFHSIGTCPYGKRCRFIHIEAPSTVQQSSPVPVKKTPIICEPKPVPAKQSTFENINGSGWSNNWNGSFASTNVNLNLNVAAPKGFPPVAAPVERFTSPVVNVSKDLPVLERRSRLGIFQQICS